jgi:hypothetical protein
MGKVKCFGIGLNKTGTKTLGKALTTLGYRVASFRPDLMDALGEGRYEPALSVAKHFDGFEDWPWPLLYKELDRTFPGSQFILTTRLDASTWFESLCKHSKRVGPTSFRKIAYSYTNPWENPDHHIKIYNDHIENVTRYFSDRPHQLLTLCWERGDGWPELCRFLGRPIPQAAFPHENRSPEKSAVVTHSSR